MPRRRRRLGSSSCQHAAGAAARRIRSPAQLFLFLERSPTPAADAQFLARRESQSSEDLEVSSAGDVFLQEGVEALNKNKASEREGGRAAEADLSMSGSRGEPIARHGVGGSLASGREEQDGADEASGFLQRRQHSSKSLTPSMSSRLQRAAGALIPGRGWWHMPFMNRVPSLRSWFRTAEQSVTAATDVGQRSKERAAAWRDGASGWRDSVKKQVAQFAGMSKQQIWHALERRLPAWTMRLLGQEPALLENVLTSDLVHELEAKYDPKNQERDHAGHHEDEQKLFFQAPQFENFLKMMQEFGFGEGVPLEPLVEKADVDRIFLADEKFEEKLVRAYQKWEKEFLDKHFLTEGKMDEHKLKKAPDSVDSGAKAMDEVRRKTEAYNVLRTLSWLYKKLVWQLPKKSDEEHEELDEPDEVAKVVMKMKSGRSVDRKNVLTKLSDIVLANYDPRRRQPSASHREKITQSLKITEAEENARGSHEPKPEGKSEAEEQLEFFESSRPVPTYHLGRTIKEAAQKQLFTEEQFDGRVVDIPAMLASILTFVDEAEVKATKPAGVGTLIGKPVMGVIQGMNALAKKIAGTGFTGAGNHGRDRVVMYKRRWTTGELPMRWEPPGADSYTYKGEYYTNLVVEGGQEPRDISINEIREPIMNGKGTMTYGNGDFYVGDWEDGKKHGFGKMTWAEPHNGQKWVRGMWHKEMSDKPPTSGTEHRVVLNAAGHVYEGKFEIKNGKRVQEDGTLTYGDASGGVRVDVYQGRLIDDVPHGEGTMRYANDNVYKGNWENGNKGVGKMTWVKPQDHNGQEWVEGQWGKNDEPPTSGTERRTTKEGNVYEGKFDARGGARKSGKDRFGFSEQDGTLTYRFPAKKHTPGDVYTGELIDNVPWGHGKMTYANGDKFEGNWNRDEKSGSGTMTWKEPADHKGQYWVQSEQWGTDTNLPTSDRNGGSEDRGRRFLQGAI